ncbi:hypothetical protein LSH36_444g02054 [Paralvinella palmiformis]|uniref:Uncharacterized protein n=1 Tax=Paralvinella palmiformis TaxID=53620 RepID=A0AAD9JB70_9ANNE|nr:hypothetical protein LSH36_444g02054 [Paralvinella palmiformis]
MSISGAIASSSTGRGPRGSISVVSYRRPSQGRSPSDMSSSTGKTPDDKNSHTFVHFSLISRHLRPSCDYRYN